MMRIPISGSRDDYSLAPTKILALGLNYEDHITEDIMQTVANGRNFRPVEPVLFAMTPNVLIGSGEEIVIPSFLDSYCFEDLRVDYEAELAIVIKDRCKHLDPEEVYDHIMGFTCFNDVSCRNIQTMDNSGWFRSKSFDTFGPVGPVLVPPDLIGDPQNLAIRTRLNGKLVQNSSTARMIFSIRDTVSFISRQFTLEAGDLIVTGTPGGVGKLAPGDIIEVEIENIGVLVNGVRKEGL